MPKVIKIFKATIIDLIVAFLFVIATLVLVKIAFGQSIDTAIMLMNTVAIDTKKDVQVDTVLENSSLKNYPEYGTKYATIEIPKINVKQDVYFGSSLEVLKKGVGHDSGSYFPGEGGSIIYMGHNSKNVFRRFSELQKGDEIIVETTYGTFKYRIYDMQLVNETEKDKLPIQRDKEILMVYTCYPFNNIGYATQRYVVYAELVEE